MGYKVSFNQIGMLSDYNLSEKISVIEQHVKLEKALSYLETQGRDCGIYLDYLRECSKLGYDMKNEKVLFPADLQAAHEETSEKIRIQEDSKKKEAFKKYTEKLYDRPEYREENLLIRAAQSPEELAKGVRSAPSLRQNLCRPCGARRMRNPVYTEKRHHRMSHISHWNYRQREKSSSAGATIIAHIRRMSRNSWSAGRNG